MVPERQATPVTDNLAKRLNEFAQKVIPIAGPSLAFLTATTATIAIVEPALAQAPDSELGKDARPLNKQPADVQLELNTYFPGINDNTLVSLITPLNEQTGKQKLGDHVTARHESGSKYSDCHDPEILGPIFQEILFQMPPEQFTKDIKVYAMAQLTKGGIPTGFEIYVFADMASQTIHYIGEHLPQKRNMGTSFIAQKPIDDVFAIKARQDKTLRAITDPQEKLKARQAAQGRIINSYNSSSCKDGTRTPDGQTSSIPVEYTIPAAETSPEANSQQAIALALLAAPATLFVLKKLLRGPTPNRKAAS